MQQLQGQKAGLTKQCEAVKAQLQTAEKAQEANMQQTLEAQVSCCRLQCHCRRVEHLKCHMRIALYLQTRLHKHCLACC